MLEAVKARTRSKQLGCEETALGLLHRICAEADEIVIAVVVQIDLCRAIGAAREIFSYSDLDLA